MIDNNYFDHKSPKYGIPGEMVSEEGIDYTLVRENIAQSNSVQSAHAQLMNSSAHRSAILAKDYTHIRVIETERGGVMLTQLFIKQ
ncbi:hypothetical protein CDO51_11285 [Natranaerobius trueperi]|uniref:SCP domain-containing protein n=1 Tax=Natranaerobius trueperi TaxID=759412 RepID=A0A226BXW3_9FIRM|nr:hypothetical protein CDO51_11285 [Natranaerobius trueperi]